MTTFAKARIPFASLSIAVLLLFFLCIYGSYYQGDSVFTSPDETANYFFATKVAESGMPLAHDSINVGSPGIVHPRSIKINADGDLVPNSFIGLPLYYGMAASALGNWALLWLTPMAAIIGALSFYFICKRLFGFVTAITSLLLLLILPPFWLYASRGMFHNVLFVSLLLICLSALMRAFDKSERGRNTFFIIAGLALGMAFSVRISEVIWVLILLGSIAMVHRRQLTISRIVSFIIPAVLVFTPVLFVNNELYGSAFTFSYSMPSLSDTLDTVSRTQDPGASWLQYFFPFGINLSQSLQMAYTYLIAYMPWYSLFVIAGMSLIFFNSIRSWVRRTLYSLETINTVTIPEIVYTCLFVIISVWMILYYGAFTFKEYIDPTKVLLGSSYLRYWLPILIMGIPIAVRGMLWVVSLWATRYQAAVTIFLVFVIVGLSVSLTVADPLQGLMQLQRHIETYEQVRSEVLANTPSEAVIIAGGADRFFFPDRRVIATLPASSSVAAEALAQVASQTSLYVYENSLNVDMVRVRELLSRSHLTTEQRAILPDQMNLTRVVPIGN